MRKQLIFETIIIGGNTHELYDSKIIYEGDRAILNGVSDDFWEAHILGTESGCWYYNHNSRKTIESAGRYSRTRLLNVTF
jgi:hypothetical protein